jgi:lysozyme family protein
VPLSLSISNDNHGIIRDPAGKGGATTWGTTIREHIHH